MNMFGALALQMPGMSGFWLVLFAVLGLAFWRLLSDRAETRRSAGTEERAEEALRRRFAKGEMDEGEYARTLKVLRERILGR